MGCRQHQTTVLNGSFRTHPGECGKQTLKLLPLSFLVPEKSSVFRFAFANMVHPGAISGETGIMLGAFTINFCLSFCQKMLRQGFEPPIENCMPRKRKPQADSQPATKRLNLPCTSATEM